MSFATQLYHAVLKSYILIALNSVFFLGGYSLLRVLRISVNWVVWIFGYLIIVASAVLCYSVAAPVYSLLGARTGNVLGILSFLIAMYAVSQWISRHWYVFVKKRTLRFVAQQSRDFLLFVRKHHTFFGWIVAAAAVGHTAVYLPRLSEVRDYEVITGFIAIGLLALAILFGVWIWFVTSIRKQRIPKVIHSVHTILTFAFLLVLVAHI
jgi:hypothetical protein